VPSNKEDKQGCRLDFPTTQAYIFAVTGQEKNYTDFTLRLHSEHLRGNLCVGIVIALFIDATRTADCVLKNGKLGENGVQGSGRGLKENLFLNSHERTEESCSGPRPGRSEALTAVKMNRTKS
jgi:hypothetical protein